MNYYDDLLQRTWMEVSLDAVNENYVNLQKKIGPSSTLMVVLKANAYGLGAVPIAKSLSDQGCKMFAVACMNEAVELKENGINQPILILTPISSSEVQRAISHSFETSLSSYQQAEQYSIQAQQDSKQLTGHLAVDVGLSRYGIRVDGRMEEALEEAVKILLLPGIRVASVFTHYTTANLPEGAALNEYQIALFREFCRRLAHLGFPLKTHCASSQVSIYYPQCNDDYIRSASLVLGLQGSLPGYEKDCLCRNSVELKTRIVQIKTIENNTPVGYGPTYYTCRRTRIAIVPIGFADGLHRVISNRGHMLLHGKLVPIIGNYVWTALRWM